MFDEKKARKQFHDAIGVHAGTIMASIDAGVATEAAIALASEAWERGHHSGVALAGNIQRFQAHPDGKLEALPDRVVQLDPAQFRVLARLVDRLAYAVNPDLFRDGDMEPLESLLSAAEEKTDD